MDKKDPPNTASSEETSAPSLTSSVTEGNTQHSDQGPVEKPDEKEDSCEQCVSVSDHDSSSRTAKQCQSANIGSKGGDLSPNDAGKIVLKQDVVVCDTINDVSREESKSHKKRNKARQKSEAYSSEGTLIKSTDSEICKHCQKNILRDNLVLHELHCSKQNNPSTTQGKDKIGLIVTKKDNESKEKKKEKPKKSHVQKASDILSKVADDDFEGLIATITELDSKCAFNKCKTLTNTLGRNCEYCTRRFCLTHLMPEIHGCGAAAKTAARRIISRDGVLHSGSGVPDRKPNQARRAQLESKMEKKLGELAGKRARNL